MRERIRVWRRNHPIGALVLSVIAWLVTYRTLAILAAPYAHGCEQQYLSRRGTPWMSCEFDVFPGIDLLLGFFFMGPFMGPIITAFVLAFVVGLPILGLKALRESIAAQKTPNQEPR